MSKFNGHIRIFLSPVFVKNLDTHLSRTCILNRGIITAEGAKIFLGGVGLDITMIYDPPNFNPTHQHKQICNISVVPRFHVDRETIKKEKYKKKSPWGR